MKKLLSAVLVTTTLASTVFAQVADADRRGGFQGQGGNRQVIRELVSAQSDIDSVLGYVSNVEVRRKLRTALLKIDNSIDMLNSGGMGDGQFDDKMVVVSLKSSEGRLYIGESKTRIQSIQIAQDKCIKAETWNSRCKTDEINLKTEEYSLRQNRLKTCSLQSTEGVLYTAQARTAVEAVSLAQGKCIKAETWNSRCLDNKVRCE